MRNEVLYFLHETSTHRCRGPTTDRQLNLNDRERANGRARSTGKGLSLCLVLLLRVPDSYNKETIFPLLGIISLRDKVRIFHAREMKHSGIARNVCSPSAVKDLCWPEPEEKIHAVHASWLHSSAISMECCVCVCTNIPSYQPTSQSCNWLVCFRCLRLGGVSVGYYVRSGRWRPYTNIMKRNDMLRVCEFSMGVYDDGISMCKICCSTT